MKRSKFTTGDGLIMLSGLSLVFLVMVWLMLAGILRLND